MVVRVGQDKGKFLPSKNNSSLKKIIMVHANAIFKPLHDCQFHITQEAFLAAAEMMQLANIYEIRVV